MEAIRIGPVAVYMLPVPGTRRRLWLVQPVAAYRAGGIRNVTSWRVRYYRTAARYV